MYAMLALVYGSYRSILISRKLQLPTTTSARPLIVVLFFSFIDVQANVLAVAAFKNTSVLSALIINSWTLPCVMLLSILLLKSNYLRTHYMGVILSMSGLALLIYGDVLNLDDPTTNHAWIGDLLCLTSATLYAVCNVAEEYLVQFYSISNFLCHIGIFGMVQSSIWAWFFEYDTLASIDWTLEIVMWIGMYVISLFCLYSTMPVMYRMTGAAFVSISLMSSNFYSLLVGLVFLDAKMPALYPFAYILVVAGAVVYNSIQPPAYSGSTTETLPILHRRSSMTDSSAHIPSCD
ncbi:DUF914-domain-containing protein [Hesseltinella vesiculosa]|uniref:DUF914-domain-containing protein n=1 Tax=Hesseltinella vesiculosa TaxID=101127 RepID=A0A1X2GNY9_9FUNG|nr:DUF914-domain-containing protein [Hesseltinella vesiculosa]